MKTYKPLLSGKTPKTFRWSDLPKSEQKFWAKYRYLPLAPYVIAEFLDHLEERYGDAWVTEVVRELKKTRTLKKSLGLSADADACCAPIEGRWRAGSDR